MPRWPETTVLRKTLIGGKTYPDDYTVIWRELPIGRIMRAPGLPPPRFRNGDGPATSNLHCSRSICCAIQRYRLPKAFTGRS
jgi:hypothetical protein